LKDPVGAIPAGSFHCSGQKKIVILLHKNQEMDFDEKAKGWDMDPDRIARAVAFADELLKAIGSRKFSSALEFGSGTGNVSFHMADKFASITLADTSEGMLEVLRQKIASGRITNMKPFLINESYPLTSQDGFDIIYTLLTLHHIKDLNRVFSDLSSVLKPGGLLFIGDLVTEDGSFHHRDPEFDGHQGFDVAELKKLMKNNELEPVMDKIFYTIGREHNSVLKHYPLFIVEAKKL
jgi:ubiquinone/menaquinone biosynthesis C-methylase UbiE